MRESKHGGEGGRACECLYRTSAKRPQKIAEKMEKGVKMTHRVFDLISMT